MAVVVAAWITRRWVRIGLTGPMRWAEELHLIRIGDVDIVARRPCRKRTTNA